MERRALHILTVCFVFFISKEMSAQSVSWSPELPTADQELVIYFNPKECDCPLSNYGGPLYVHTGLIYSGDRTWKNVVGTWGDNGAQPIMTKESEERYVLTISPDLFAFYESATSNEIEQVALVVRSEDGSQQTKDLFIPIFRNGQAQIIRPEKNSIFSLIDTVDVEAVILGADSVSIKINDSVYLREMGAKATISLTELQVGNNSIVVEGTVNNQVVQEETSFFVNQSTRISDLPSLMFPNGATTIGDTTRFVLRAPGKKHIHLLGDFNSWNISEESQMFKSEDGKTFWLDVIGLAKGKYAYQYVVDGTLKSPDPYSRIVLDPWNDQYIPTSVYPNPTPYPSGKAEGIVSVLEVGSTKYEWKVQDFVKPQKEDLVIYELLIRDFVEDHSFRSVKDSLDYLKSLGVNAIELMPIMEFEGNSSWGYNTSFHMALDKYYGTEIEFKEFIDACHEKGIAVILDFVINHAYGQSPMVQMYWDSEKGQPSEDNPWFNAESPNPVFSFGYDYDHESKETKDYFKDVLAYWVEEFKVDGYRLDFTKGLTNIPGDGSHYDYGRVLKLRSFSQHVWDIDPDAYMIMEHFAPNREEKEISGFGMMLWGNHNHNFNQVAMGYAQESDISGASYKARGFEEPHLVAYMESHDEERMLYKTKAFGNSNSSYDVRELETGIQRAEMASLLYFSIPGPKMIWMFGELGYDVSINDPCRVCEKPILWNYNEDPLRTQLKDHYAEIIELRKKYPVFNTEDFQVSGNGLLKKIRLNSPDHDVVVLANAGMEMVEATFSSTEGATWYEYYSGQRQKAINGEVIRDLGPGEYALYSTVPMGPVQPRTNAIEILPTLVVENVIIEAKLPLEDVRVYSATGQLIFNQKKGGSILQIDTGFWLPGVYVVYVKDEGGNIRKTKIVKTP